MRHCQVFALLDTVGFIPHWCHGNGLCAILDERGVCHTWRAFV